jgi:hypothetical protein
MLNGSHFCCTSLFVIDAHWQIYGQSGGPEKGSLRFVVPICRDIYVKFLPTLFKNLPARVRDEENR